MLEDEAERIRTGKAVASTVSPTFCYATVTDPQDPGSYTRSGLEIVFRPHAGKYAHEDATVPKSKPFFRRAAFETELEMRQDAAKWETTLHASKRFRPSSLQQPMFDIHYNAREAGGPARDAERIKYACVVDASPWLVEELVEHRMRSRFAELHDCVFATRNGTRRQRSNISRQILAPAITAANKARAKAERAPIASAVTNHSLRRTFASLLYEAGASPAYVMAQMGHTSSQLAFEVYAKVMERARETGVRMDALVRGPVSARIGTSVENVASTDNEAAMKKPLFPAAS